MSIANFAAVSRSEFVRGVSALGAVGIAVWAGGCEQVANRPTRRNIANLSATDPVIQTYRAAITAMKALSPSDPRNWTKQAEIHNTHCPHGCWFFLPWHRWYLLYFERICRKLTGDNGFALPYWNWTSHPAVPDVFWDTASPLYDSNRVVTQGEQADPGWVGPTIIENILSTPDFFAFASGISGGPNGNFHLGGHYGMLEQNPHNNIHRWIGGDMGAFMSPLDPIFWTHHNMIDCLWADWNINRNNPNINDSAWTNEQFTDFVDENGNQVTVDVALSPLLPLLDYQFEPCDPAGQTTRKSQAQLQAFLKAGAPSTLRFTQRTTLRTSITTAVGESATAAVRIQMAALQPVLAVSAKNRALLIASDVQIPAQRDYFVRIFLNKPDATAKTPIADPHYAGSFAFFFDESAMKGSMAMTTQPKAGYVVDVTPTVVALGQASGLASGQLAVSLVPVAYEHRKATGERLQVGRLELGIAQF
jgi:tyrosinase